MRTSLLRIGRSVGSPALALAALLGGCGPGDPSVENVVLVSLDTTRRDHLSVYGYPRATTPRLDAIADRCAIFETASAQATITKPSHASIFTGLYPHTHELGGNTRPLADRFVTLTEVLAARGFATGAFVGGFPLKKRVAGLVQGFETYDSRFRTARRDGAETTQRALAWIEQLPSGTPYFLFLHYYDAHGPLTEGDVDVFGGQSTGRVLEFIPEYQQLEGPDGESLTRLNEYVDRYDALVRRQDAFVGRVLDAIDLETTLLIVTADHGETLADRESILNLDHGNSLFEELIAIPLLFCGPRVVPGRYPQVVETVDIMPTVLDLIEGGLSAQFEFQGQSLAPLFQDAERDLDGISFASNRSKPAIHLQRGYTLDDDRFIHSVRKGSWKLIRYPGVEEDYVELYDLASDPGERRNVASEHPEVTDDLERLLDEWLVGEPETEPAGDLTAEERRQLEALGYIGD